MASLGPFALVHSLPRFHYTPSSFDRVYAWETPSRTNPASMHLVSNGDPIIFSILSIIRDVHLVNDGGEHALDAVSLLFEPVNAADDAALNRLCCEVAKPVKRSSSFYSTCSST